MMEATATRRKRSRGPLWLAIHGWLGLPIWAFLCFICLTGSVATVSEEIVWLVDPAARSNPPSPDAVPLGYDRILQRVEEQVPGAAVIFMAIPVKDINALQLYVGRPDGSEGMIYVNPYTGSIQGDKAAFDLREMLRELHGWLLIPFTARYSLGWYIVSAMSIPLMASLITGLVVYKKFWRAILRPRLRFRQGGRVFWGDFHRLAGLLSIPFIFIMASTAMWFLIQAALSDSGYKLPGDVEPPTVARRQVVSAVTRDAAYTVGIDHAIAIMRERFPGLTPAYVFMPTQAYDPIHIMGRSPSYPLILESAFINPYSGKVLAARGIGQYSKAAFFIKSMRPLHTGDFAGLWLKLVYFAFGLLLAAMSLSGMMVWAKRSARATAQVFESVRPRRNREARQVLQ